MKLRQTEVRTMDIEKGKIIMQKVIIKLKNTGIYCIMLTMSEVIERQIHYSIAGLYGKEQIWIRKS